LKVGVILAAGASRRMGQPKALLPWAGSTFLAQAAQRLQGLGLEAYGVVTRAELETACAQQLPLGWRVWVNPDPEPGMLSSLQVALRNLPVQAECVLVSLVDQPRISVATFELMAREVGSEDWCSPSFAGRAGHPVGIGRACFAALLAAPPQGSPRDVLKTFPRRLIVCDDPGILQDVDTPEDLSAASAQAET
jgi:molybdenum cofactor cytidylyltransferase